MADDAVLYKMVGPVLIKQTKAEVNGTVTERLKFVNAEMYVYHSAVPTPQMRSIQAHGKQFSRIRPFVRFQPSMRTD